MVMRGPAGIVSGRPLRVWDLSLKALVDALAMRNPAKVAAKRAVRALECAGGYHIAIQMPGKPVQLDLGGLATGF
jgi:hypothetical protein